MTLTAIGKLEADLIIKAPHPIPKMLFLAGSIEMGAAENWQEQVALVLGQRCIILNPRRDDWDSSWIQDMANPTFLEQVSWELAAMERADTILMYFSPGTRSPITLLELGLFARSGKLIVCCPQGFWRRGNVDIVCKRYGVPVVESLETLIRYGDMSLAVPAGSL